MNLFMKTFRNKLWLISKNNYPKLHFDPKIKR